jgi:DNA-binding SARP family transcriptional activator
VYLNQAHTWVIDSDQLQSVMDERDPALDSLEAALALYRGEPLPENRYDDWAMRVRGRLQRAHRAAALRLIVALAGAGQLERARSHAEMLLDDDPLDEEAEYSLLTVLAEMDLRVEAIRRYDKFERRLHAELGVAPDLRLQRVARSLRSALGAD